MSFLFRLYGDHMGGVMGTFDFIKFFRVRLGDPRISETLSRTIVPTHGLYMGCILASGRFPQGTAHVVYTWLRSSGTSRPQARYCTLNTRP